MHGQNILEIEQEDLLNKPEARITLEGDNVVVFKLQALEKTVTLTNRGIFKYQDEFYEIKASEAVSAIPADYVILSCQYTNKPDDF